MAKRADGERERGGIPWRPLLWGAAALLWLTPLIAMQFTAEVAWEGEDFVAFGLMLLGAGLGLEILMRRGRSVAYRAAAVVGVVAGFLLVWLAIGVGIIGRDGDPANLLYASVIAVGLAGAYVARLQPEGMARTLIAMAMVQATIAAIAVVAALGAPWSGPAELIALNGLFVALFAGAAWLFQQASRAQGERRAV